MKADHLRQALATGALAVLATACVDNGYDLSDIDTTTRVAVNDLTIPVNIDVITLGNIITYDDNSKIKPVNIEGNEVYALSETGTFHSDPIEIAEVRAEAPHISPTEAWLDKFEYPSSGAARAAALTVGYDITPMGNPIDYNAGEVDEAIVDLKSIKTDITFTITLRSLNVATPFTCADFSDVHIQMPKGLTATCSQGSYNATTGLWVIPSISTTTASVSLSLHASAIDFKTAGTYIDANHRFAYSGEFRVLSGHIAFTVADITKMPQNLHFRAEYGLSDLVASSFCGTVNYKLDGVNIAPVSLSDVPDFLSGEGTNLIFTNPQIYLGVNNPVANDGLDCSAGITLTAERDGGRALTFTPDVNRFTIRHNLGVDGPYNFVLSPSDQELMPPAEYAAGLEHVPFTTLGNLLEIPAGMAATAGIPDRIGITLNDPRIPAQSVTDFVLGRSLPGVRGSYELLAPLALTDRSTVVYRDTVDGWNDEDVDAITVEKLSLSVTVDNDCPVGAELYAWPLDVNGNRIGGVEIKSSYLAAATAGQHVAIEMTGKVQHLDGIMLEARLDGATGTALMPSQSIKLTDIRAKVTGYYEKEL